MNNFNDYLYLTEYTAPIFSALSCTILLLFSYADSYTHTEIRIKKITIFYLCVSLFSWLSVFLYIYFPGVFVPTQSFLYLSLLYAQVLFYHIFYILTGLGNEERFSVWHYLIPAIIVLILFVWSFFVPYEVQLDIVLGRGKVIPQDYKTYTFFFLSKMPVRILYCVIYIILTFLRLAKYGKKINTSTSLVRKPTRWLLLLALLTLTSIVISVVGGIMRGAGLYFTLILGIASLAMFAQHIILTFLVIQRSYTLYITFPGREHIPMEAVTVGQHGIVVPECQSIRVSGTSLKKKRKPYSRTSSRVLVRRKFDSYFKKHTPYLDSSLKITDLAEKMDINRTYLSNFVNRTYGVNFNRYVNRCRLRYLERLIELSSNGSQPLSILVNKAGFADLKHYRRAVRAEQENNQTKSL